MKPRSLILTAGTAALGLWLLRLPVEPQPEVSRLSETRSTASIETTARKVPAPITASAARVPPTAKENTALPPPATWKLDSSNFEQHVGKCFRDEPCELTQDPMELYRLFKKTGNVQANDHLIAYLRRNLKDIKFASRYKNALKAMIDDFYPPEKKPFQEAAFYNYLGNLKKSLDLYLDLEKKSAANPRLRPAPKLSIANTYYDMGRLAESLPYYQAAREQFLANGPDVRGPDRRSVLEFIERRIEEIRVKSPSCCSRR